jgi:hypothetical protein
VRIVAGVSYPIEAAGAFKNLIGIPAFSVVPDASDTVRRPIFSWPNR